MPRAPRRTYSTVSCSASGFSTRTTTFSAGARFSTSETVSAGSCEREDSNSSTSAGNLATASSMCPSVSGWATSWMPSSLPKILRMPTR